MEAIKIENAGFYYPHKNLEPDSARTIIEHVQTLIYQNTAMKIISEIGFPHNHFDMPMQSFSTTYEAVDTQLYCFF